MNNFPCVPGQQEAINNRQLGNSHEKKSTIPTIWLATLVPQFQIYLYWLEFFWMVGDDRRRMADASLLEWLAAFLLCIAYLRYWVLLGNQFRRWSLSVSADRSGRSMERGIFVRSAHFIAVIQTFANTFKCDLNDLQMRHKRRNEENLLPKQCFGTRSLAFKLECFKDWALKVR